MGGHESLVKKPTNHEIASQILGIFDERGSRIRKPCTGGKLLKFLKRNASKPQGVQQKLDATVRRSQQEQERNLPLIAASCCPIYGRVGTVDELEAGWFRPRLMIIFTSTRRFCERPSRVVLSATESVLP